MTILLRRARKKPVEIEYMTTGTGYDKDCAVLAWCGGVLSNLSEHSEDVDDKVLFYIRTLEGDMAVSSGDVVIRGVQGEFYPCKPDIFQQTYDTITASTEEPSA